MLRLFFNKNKQVRQWAVLFFTLLTPFLVSIWGILLTIKSINLSREANKNRDQINAITDMVKELKHQNDLLQTSVSIQDSQYRAYSGELKYSKRPLLRCEYMGGSTGEISEAIVDISNSGGEISNFRWISIKGGKIDSSTAPQNGMMASGSSYTLHITDLKDGSGVRLAFTDRELTKYTQDLIWNRKTENIQVGGLRELPKSSNN